MIMAMKTSIDTNRLGMLFRKFITENWRNLMLRCGVVIGFMMLGGLLIGLFGADAYAASRREYLTNYCKDVDPLWTGMSILLAPAWYIFTAISASMAFSGLGSKESRISDIMFPASMLEKYLVRWVIYVPGFIVVFLVGIVLSDWCRMSVLMMTADMQEFIRPLRPDLLLTTYEGHTRFQFSVQVFIFSALGVQALFFLGSILWHKAQFIKSFIALSLISIGYFIIAYLFVMMINAHSGPELLGCGISVAQWRMIYYALLACVMAFGYGVAYLRYREMDVVPRW